MTRLAAIAFALGLVACAPTETQVIASCEALTGTSYGAPQFDACLTQATVADLQREAAAITAGEIVSAAIGQAIVNTYYPPPYYGPPSVVVWRHSGGFHR